MWQYIFQTPGLLLAGAVLIVLYWINQRRKLYGSLPPGPPTLPLLGNLTQLSQGSDSGKERLRTLAELVNQHGANGVGTIYIGTNPTVFVTELETIKKILNDDALTGRPLSTRDSFFERKGLIWTDGELWKEQRRFALSTLRDFGMGKSWLQDLIIEEAQDLVEDLRKTNAKAVFPDQYLSPCVANVICAISYGQRFSHQDDNFRRLSSLIGTNVQLMARNQIVENFPFLRLIPFSAFRARHLAWFENAWEVTGFLQNLVAQHQSTFHEGEPRDYIHAFMKEAEKQKSNSASTFSSVQLERSILNLFGAGTDTTSTTLQWAILHLLENPEVYSTVQEEIDRVIRDGSYPTLEDRDQLPYTQATIFEVQRMANLVPIAGRCTKQETILNGYTIPAGVNVFPLLSAVHEDPKYFPEPLVFKPERFLDEAGALLGKVEGFIPFSIGKRFCLGQALAQMELYIFFVSMVKYFRFRLPTGQTISSDNSAFGIVNSPIKYTVIFEPR